MCDAILENHSVVDSSRFVVAATASMLSIASSLASDSTGQRRPNDGVLAAFEHGLEVLYDPRERFTVKEGIRLGFAPLLVQLDLS